MTLPQDLTPLVRDRLREPDRLPPPRIAEMGPLVHQTTQERGFLPHFDRGRFQTMFSATKFLVAGAVLALFGVSLLSGMLTQQSSQEPVPPAAASASASPEVDETAAPETAVRTDLLPGVDLVTEEVEPGVYRVLSDGMRPLSFEARIADELLFKGVSRAFNLIAGHDGSVWMARRDEAFRLGDQRSHEVTDPRYIKLDADGVLWLGDDPSRAIDRAGEKKPTRYRSGAPWGYMHVDNGTRIVRLDDPERPSYRAPKLAAARFTLQESRIASGPDDDVWVFDQWKGRGRPDRTTVAHFDGSRWTRFDDAPGRVNWAAVGPDGTVVAQYEDLLLSPRLTRFDGSRWVEFAAPAASGASRLASTGIHALEYEPQLGPDGTLWYGYPFCRGVARNDGSTWTRFLPEVCVYRMDVGPDGSVWVQGVEWQPTWPTTEPDGGLFLVEFAMPEMGTLVHTYVITPEAVATTE